MNIFFHSKIFLNLNYKYEKNIVEIFNLNINIENFKSNKLLLEFILTPIILWGYNLFKFNFFKLVLLSKINFNRLEKYLKQLKSLLL